MRMRIYAQHLKAQNSNKKGNKINQKKFNNLTEYKNSAEFKIDEAAKEKQLSDDIELAVEALCRLGVGKRTANEWVDIGIKSGIQSSDTQSLVKFALRRGL
jgi:Holliday junction resolvasome RuvABC DNA-binding subunit